MKAQVSAFALAFCLAGCGTAAADKADTASAATMPAAGAQTVAPAAAPTLEDARAFRARAEKELG